MPDALVLLACLVAAGVTVAAVHRRLPVAMWGFAVVPVEITIAANTVPSLAVHGLFSGLLAGAVAITVFVLGLVAVTRRQQLSPWWWVDLHNQFKIDLLEWREMRADDTTEDAERD